MSSYVICCTPAHGHVMPLLTIARHLVEGGHRVRFITGGRYRDRVQDCGVTHVALPADADVDLDRAGDIPERRGLKGPEAIRFDLRHLFLGPARGQYATVRAALAAEPADAVLTEPLFLGSALLDLLPRAERPPVVALGIFPLGAASRDTAPFGLGILPMPGAIGRLRNRLLQAFSDRMVFGAVQQEADDIARQVIGRPFRTGMFNWTSAADALVQFTVPSFEYPRSDLPASVHFAGPLPLQPATMEPPRWWAELDEGRPVVHVTQGTVANADFGQLACPAIEGLANDDVLVVVSTGGRPVEDLGPLPGNVRAAGYLPYADLFDKVDVLVTNGGYGTVQFALTHGVPVVAAGQTEDKIEVTARVGWSGAGINLRTNAAAPGQVAGAVRRVLHEPGYRAAAQRIGQELRAADALGTLDRVLSSVQPAPLGSGIPVLSLDV